VLTSVSVQSCGESGQEIQRQQDVGWMIWAKSAIAGDMPSPDSRSALRTARADEGLPIAAAAAAGPPQLRSIE
jgi:hypothetical protein